MLQEQPRPLQHSLTHGSLNKAIWVLAVPMVLEMAMESVFAVTDVLFLGRIGTEAVAAVGLTEALLWIVFSLGFGVSIGTTALVARRIGEGKPERAAVAAGQAVWLGILVSIPVIIAGVVFAEELLMTMGASTTLAGYGRTYLTISLASSAAIMLLFINNAVFRAAGDARLAMWALWLANGLNLVLDPCLIFGLGPFPELGLEGAAIASVLGRSSGVVFQVYILFGGRCAVRLTLRRLRLELGVMRTLLRLSLGATGQQLVESASWMILVRIIASFGPSAVAGYTVGMRILTFAFLPAWGLANAAATLVGQNLGAGRPDRAEGAAWRAGGWAAGALFLVTVLFVPLAETLIRLFVDAPDVVRQGEQCLRIVSYGYVAFAVGMVATQSLNGAGDTTTPLWLTIVSLWIVKLPLAYVLAHLLGMGSSGVFTAITISYAILAIMGLVIFRRGKWKEREV